MSKKPVGCILISDNTQLNLQSQTAWRLGLENRLRWLPE